MYWKEKHQIPPMSSPGVHFTTVARWRWIDVKRLNRKWNRWAPAIMPHGIGIEEMEPRMFSFNSPFGACPVCNGLGFLQRIDPDLIIEDKTLSIAGGALSNIFASMEVAGYYRQTIDALAKEHNTNLNVPYKDLPQSFVKELLYGTGDRTIKFLYKSRTRGTESMLNHPFEGVIKNLERRYRETTSDYIKDKMQKYMNISPYEFGNIFNVEPLRPRKLLLHKREINKLIGYTTLQGLTLIPLKLYLDDRGRAKMELAVAKGKKLYDKRHDLAKKDADRRMQQAKKR